MRATWISTISSKTISSPPLKDTMLLLPLVTWNSPHLQAMDYMIYIKIFSFQLINAFCLNCTCAISKPYQIHIWDIYGSRTTPDASIGVVPYQTHIKSIYGPYMGHPSSPTWTLDFEPAFSPRFLPTLSLRSIFFHWSAVFTHLEPAIPFFHWSAVFTHLEPAIPFFPLVSGFYPP